MKDPDNVFPPWVWAVYTLLFALSIPWYLPAKLEMQLVMGLPLWLVSAIAAIFLMACFSTWVIYKFWQEEASVPENF